jgi:hypothetical protein
MVCADGRGARVVEWDGLENRCGARPHRGFESHPLRLIVYIIVPSPNGEGFFLLFYLLSYKKIVFYFLVKVDGQKSRGNRDKCPAR